MLGWAEGNPGETHICKDASHGGTFIAWVLVTINFSAKNWLCFSCVESLGTVSSVLGTVTSMLCTCVLWRVTGSTIVPSILPGSVTTSVWTVVNQNMEVIFPTLFTQLAWETPTAESESGSSFGTHFPFLFLGPPSDSESCVL